ncbi:uncharacterized protein PG986_003969 [Apiospora aurea]|uniref:Uncharacterized protein n=1 Tax=Apiospora aurea TaxID=335848 RepID=A0ABR1QL93_9PEZI
MAAPPQPPKSAEETVFSEARAKFLASLSANDQQMYSPCASSNDLLQAVEKLTAITAKQRDGQRHEHNATRWMSAIRRLSDALKPYFKVVEVFVSSNPQYAALKTTELVRKHVGAIYGVLQIFHAAVRVFTKADGKLKITPVVSCKLMWTPFDVRFAELTKVLSYHQHTLIELLNVSSAAALSDEAAAASNNRQQTAAEWDRSRDEREAAAYERAAAAKERQDHSEWRQEISSKLDQITQNVLLEKQNLNETQQHMDELFTAARQAISSPNDEDSRDIASSMRLDGTSQWVFSTPEFQCWSNGPTKPIAEESSGDEKSPGDEEPFEGEEPFGDNVMWITGASSLPSFIFIYAQQTDVDQCLGESASLDPIAEFEESILITCAGLVERCPGSIAPNSLRLVHISIKETLDSLVANRVWIDQYLNRGLHCIISDIAGAFLDAARCCLLELTRKKEQQTAYEDVNSISDPASQDMANRFVVHAASNMLIYLEDAALGMKSVENLHVHVRSAIREALTHLLPILSDFVNKPLLLSRWLFDLYESRPRGHPRCTAMSAFAHWIRRHWSRDMVVDKTFLQVLVTFDRELARIVADWGDSLQQRPDIIWDEMASFSNSQLFYNPGSTLISYQDVSAPDALGVWSKPLTTVSKTNTSGDMKGVLSIWTTLPLQSLRTSQHVNLSVLCEGWVAKYELWSIETEPKVRLSAELPIDEQDTLLTLKCWLSYPFPDQFWFPTAISDNVQSFSILKTVFTLHTAKRDGEYQWSSQHLLGHLQPPATTLLDMTGPCQYSYNMHFSPNGCHVAISEATSASPAQFTSGPQTVSVYGMSTVNLLNPVFELEKCLKFSRGAEILRNIAFHPTRTAIAIKACSRDVVDVKKWYTYIHMWSFRLEYPASVTSYQISSEREMVRIMNFSACGSYFTATMESGRCEVIQVFDPGLAPPTHPRTRQLQGIKQRQPAGSPARAQHRARERGDRRRRRLPCRNGPAAAEALHGADQPPSEPAPRGWRGDRHQH